MIEIDRAADHRAASEWARAALTDPRAVILDTETTDLRGYICDIAIVRAMDDEVLLNTLVNPGVPIEPGARRVHGISDDDVAGAPRFGDLWLGGYLGLGAVLNRASRVLVYNAEYDYGRFMAENDRTPAAELPPPMLGQWECIMLQYAAWVGQWNEYHGNYRWHKLTGGDHRALGDCRAARARLQEMAAG